MRAWREKLVLKIVERTDEIIEGEITSVGPIVPEGLEVGDRVVVGKFAGQLYKEHIIINHNEILIIHE